MALTFYNQRRYQAEKLRDALGQERSEDETQKPVKKFVEPKVEPVIEQPAEQPNAPDETLTESEKIAGNRGRKKKEE